MVSATAVVAGERELISGSPRVLEIMRILADAGDAGECAPDIARRFTHMSVQRRNSRVNQYLNQLRPRGYVRRCESHEPSHYYNNVRMFRWFITPAGREYLASGGFSAVMAVAQERRQLSEAAAQVHEAQRQQVIAAAPALVRNLPPDCKTARAELIIKLRSRNLRLHEIGEVFSISRERVRQIIRDISTEVCLCAACSGIRRETGMVLPVMSVHVRPVKYLVSVWPEGEETVNTFSFSITVSYRGKSRWAVERSMYVLSADDAWDYEVSDDRDNDEWLTAHRFSLEDALALASKHAPNVSVMGKTAVEILAMEKTGEVYAG
jgi:hypothetical protein